MNKKWIIIPLVIIVLAAGGFFGYKKFFAKKKKEEPKKVVSKKAQLVNQIELGKRPYLTLVPREDGREVSMTIDKLQLGEENVEYELEYQAGNMIQGAGGRIDFTQEPAPVTKKLLFGSCSKGKCTYDENVSGGSLTLTFAGKEGYALKGDFTLNKMSEKEGIFSSRDAKVSLEVGSKDLPADVYVIVASTMGLPGKVEGKVISGPVGFFTANKATLKSATLTFKSHDDLSKAKIMMWDGSQWQDLEGKAGEEEISASVDQLGVFVLMTP